MGVNSGPFTASRASWVDEVWSKIVGCFRCGQRPLGDLRLRGKESDVVLYALEKERADKAAAAA